MDDARCLQVGRSFDFPGLAVTPEGTPCDPLQERWRSILLEATAQKEWAVFSSVVKFRECGHL